MYIDISCEMSKVLGEIILKYNTINKMKNMLDLKNQNKLQNTQELVSYSR